MTKILFEKRIAGLRMHSKTGGAAGAGDAWRRAKAALPVAAIMVMAWATGLAPVAAAAAAPIDRHALVSRHDVTLAKADFQSPLTVGNGNFAATVDVTGMQSFPEDYRHGGIGLNTMANWAWHSFPNPQGYKLEDAFKSYDEHGRQVGYPTLDKTPAGQWLRANPHRLPLGQMGMTLYKADGTTATLTDLTDIHQKLDLWTGTITSHFNLESQPVDVVTVCALDCDAVTFKIASPLLAMGRLRPFVHFPYAPDSNFCPPLNFAEPQKHKTRVVSQGKGKIVLARTLDATRFDVALGWTGGAIQESLAQHLFVIKPAASADQVTLRCDYSPTGESAKLPGVDAVAKSSADAWKKYWLSGGAIDFSGSTDPRAAELERRVVLSQYLERVQTAGDVPAQETGLTVNTWFGKQHLEMTWWNEAHYFLWGRPELAERSMAWYQKVLPVAEAIAKQRGYRGARWPKMVGIDARESPGINPLIVWNQPHIIHMAELAYRAHPGKATLEKYKTLVLETAQSMADMTWLDPVKKRYVLGPPLCIAQEIYDRTQSQNPTYELAYWRWGLETAQAWRERLGLPREKQWDDVIDKLSPLPTKGGLYVAMESIPDTWDNPASRADHPSFLMADGFLPKGPMVDEPTMRRTLDAVLARWDFAAKIWGWDYPMMAMTAARLGEPEKAVDILLMAGPHNAYGAAGHCWQRDSLPLYLPANGSLLSAAAMMAAGWDGSPGDAPGFPKNGKWNVKYEGIAKMP
jgi:hypothetical protein